MEYKIKKKCFVSEIMAFEIVAVNSAYCCRNTCHWQLMREQIVLRFHIRLKVTFCNSIYLEFVIVGPFCSKFHAHFRNGKKKCFVSEIMAFEIVAVNSAYCCRNTCHWQLMREQIVLRFHSDWISDWRLLFATQFTSNWREKRVIVGPFWFQQCLEPVNTFIS